MDTKYAISIIVPFYNVENYLENCLSSIRRQTFTDYKVIMIDDGSTDTSGEIAQRYANKFKNFVYYRLNRGGVGNARNFGVSKADSEYIAFVDSDDSIKPTYLETLYNTSVDQDADVVCCNYEIYSEKTGFQKPVVLRKQRAGTYTAKSMVRLVLGDFYVRSYLWNKLWRKHLFDEHNIMFPSMYFEDIATTVRLSFFANKVVAVDEPLYCYTKRKNSIMSSYNVERLNDYTLTLGIITNFLNHNGGTDLYKRGLNNLKRTIFFVNTYSILRMHWVAKTPVGILKNIKAFLYCLFCFSDNNFCINEEIPNMSCYVMNPEYYKKKYKRTKPESTRAVTQNIQKTIVHTAQRKKIKKVKKVI